MFGSTNIVKDNDKEKYVGSEYGIAYDEKAEWSSGNYRARNVVIFGVIIIHHFILITLKMIF